jgi:hypothetical protein
MRIKMRKRELQTGALLKPAAGQRLLTGWTADSRASGNSKLTCRSTHGRELDVTTKRGHSGEMIGDVYEEASRGLYTGAIGVALPMTRQSSIVGQRGSRVNPSFFNHQGAETP